jgi:hypothetical protein
MAQSSEQSWRGIHSFKHTFAAAGDDGSFAITLPTASTTYVAHCRLWVPSNFDGGAIGIEPINFTGVSYVQNFRWVLGTNPFEEWYYLETQFTVAADVAGDINIQLYVPLPTVGRYYYTDGWQIEEKSVATTYCDGDQEGCSWQGSPHASASDRSALSWAGGELQDLTDDLSLIVQQATGMGTARGRNNIVDLAVVPGGDFQRRKIQTRRSGPRGVITGCSLSDLHAKREALYTGLYDDLGEPVRIRYAGATTPKILRWHYNRGFEFARHDNFNERVTLTGDSTDPLWYAEDETSAILDSQDSTAFRYIARRVRNTGAWDNLGVSAGGGEIFDLARGPDGAVYVAGNFSSIDGVANTGGIARYDPIANTWSAVGTGVTSGSPEVDALAFDAAGNLYAGGAFAQMGGVANTLRIAKWNGSTWSAMGTGANNTVIDLLVNLSGEIIAGGVFTSMSGVANTAGVAQWNGSAWSEMAGGVAAGNVEILALNPNGTVYAGGTFTTIGGTSANRIASWDGSAWSAMGTGANNTVKAIAVSSSGIVYAGGLFTTMGGISAARIAQWNGITWSVMGGGSSSDVLAIAVGPDGIVWASGNFISTSSILFSRWNGSTWVDADIDLTSTPRSIMTDNQDAVIASNYDVYAGFNTAATFAHSGAVTVTNPGTTLFLPLIQIGRSGGTDATIISVRNETTGRELFLSYALLDGETLAIDLKNQSVISDFFGNRFDAILRNSDFGTFALKRDGNIISCFVDTAGGPTISAALRGFAPFASFDG